MTERFILLGIKAVCFSACMGVLYLIKGSVSWDLAFFVLVGNLIGDAIWGDKP